jgi:CRP-like cAMP-binding protein
MDFDNICKSLCRIHPLTEAAWQDFKDLLETQELGRNEYLVHEGEKVRFCYLLTEGVVRVYFNNEGTEYNKTFFIPGMFPTPLTALISDLPSMLSFQALLPSRLVRFSYKGFRALFEKHRCLESLLLVILEQEWIAKEAHDIQMVTNDATTNYLLFREKYPGLENCIPQYHIASFLGITPIQLSRIRARLSKSRLS